MGALLGSLTHRSIDGLNFRGIAYFKSFCNGFRIAQQMGLLMKAGGKSQSHNLKCMPGVVKFNRQCLVWREKPPTSICNCQLVLNSKRMEWAAAASI